MRLYLQDLRRGLTMWTFWLAFVMIIATSIYRYFDAYLWEAVNYLLKNYGFIGTINSVTVALCNDFIAIPALLGAVITYGTVTCEEMKNGYMQNELTRIKPHKFIIVRILSTATIGFLLITLVYLLWFIVMFIIDPNPSVPLTTFSGPIGSIYEKSLWLYLVFYYLQYALLTSGYALFSMGVSIICRNQYLGYVVPFIYYISRNVLYRFLPEQLEFICTYFPFSLTTPLYQSFLSTIIIFPVSIILIYLGYRRWRKGNW